MRLVGLLNDWDLKAEVMKSKMIDPFEPELVREVDRGELGGIQKVLSFGLSSFGYDIRLEPNWKVFDPCLQSSDWPAVIDPKDPGQVESCMASYYQEGSVLIPAGGFARACTVEMFRMPRDVCGISFNKSTYVRCGLILNQMVLEPGWSGQLTCTIVNPTGFAARVYAGEGIGQIVFWRGRPVQTAYDDRAGKYNNSKGITAPKV